MDNLERLDKLKAYGESLGYEGELQTFVREQQQQERDERSAAREEKKRQLEAEEKKRELEAEEKKRELEAEEQKRVHEESRLKHEREEAQKKREHELEVMKLKAAAGESRRDSTVPVSVKTPRLPVFQDEKDTIDAYLDRFERFATTHGWAKETWASNLSALITGKALEVYSRLPVEEAESFDKLKAELLDRYHLNAEGFRRKLRESTADDGESPLQFLTRLEGYLSKWLETSKTKKNYEGLKYLMLSEQFITICNNDLATFLKERTCTSMKELGEMANKYLEAHGQQLSDLCTTSQTANRRRDGTGKTIDRERREQSGRKECWACGQLGHLAFECRGQQRGSQSFKAGGVGEIKCYKCGGVGHFARVCPSSEEATKAGGEKDQKGDRRGEKPHEVGAVTIIESTSEGCAHGEVECSCVANDSISLACGKRIDIMNAGSCQKVPNTDMPVCEGFIGQQRVQTLRDTGCSGVIVKRKFVGDELLTGQNKLIVRIDNTIVKAPVANIDVQTPYYSGKTEAVCLEDALYDLVIGNINGARKPDEPVTQEICVGGAVETRAQQAKRNEVSQLRVLKHENQDVTPELIRELQKEDGSLAKLREMTVPRERGGSVSYFVEEKNILYRKFQHRKYNNGKEVRQVVVPKGLRKQVMMLAHDSIMGGHLGAKRTEEKVLTSFFWPGVGADVRRYCQSCDVCQKTIHKGKIASVPLEKQPVIDTPFKRVSIDIVGPIHPASTRGNRFILTLVDHASRYPEAVALKNIDAITVAEALITIYGRVGIPQEVLSDRGTQFVSDLMKETCRLLGVKQLRTTPYHPACNGLVERFNGTMKQMLKRWCAEQPNEWDRYIGPLLFAYREVPQESTGFSPFELLYGRTVRGPMQILRELWTKDDSDEEVRNSYQYVVDLRERLEETLKIACQNVTQSQKKYKHHYDKKSRPRRLSISDRVLVLLPSHNNKLLMQWKGPYRVTNVLNGCNYRVHVKGKERTYHINLLKKYVSRGEPVVESDVEEVAAADVVSAGMAVITYANEQPEDGSGDDGETACDITLDFRRESDSRECYKDVKISAALSAEQKKEAEDLLHEYRDVFSDVPGETNLLEHSIETTSNDPVRVKPYPIPYNVRQSLSENIQEMLDMGVIRESNSPYSTPVVIVQKKDGSNRICVDYRRLNKVTVFDSEPMVKAQDIFIKAKDAKFYSKFDMTKGYWQIPMKEEDVMKTAFVTPDGCYEFLKMPFGLVNSGATFTRMMRKLLDGVKNAQHYIDDCLIHTLTWEEHLETVREFLQRTREANLRVRPSKCLIGANQVEFVGHKVGEGEVGLHEDNISKIQGAVRPQTKTQVRAFLGLTGYYREYIPHYAEIALPLTDLTKSGQPVKVKWQKEQEEAFEKLKQVLVTKPVLKLPDMTKPFVLRTDASDVGIGAVLLQEYGDHLFPVSYVSKKLLQRERAYSIMEKECLAIVWAVKKFSTYLFGAQFVLKTDHQPLAYLNQAKYTNSRIMRWALFLQPYQIVIESIKGADNIGADYLSRMDV